MFWALSGGNQGEEYTTCQWHLEKMIPLNQRGKVMISTVHIRWEGLPEVLVVESHSSSDNTVFMLETCKPYLGFSGSRKPQ